MSRNYKFYNPEKLYFINFTVAGWLNVFFKPHERISAEVRGNYIHLNPIRAGIVEKAQHSIYSSASNYVNEGLLKLELADNPIIDVTKKNEFWKYYNYDE